MLGRVQGWYEMCCRLYECGGTGGARCQIYTPPLTICDLQLSLGQDAACNGQGLADIVAAVSPLHRRNGQVAAGRHREATVGLLRLVGKEQILEKKRNKRPIRENARPAEAGNRTKHTGPPWNSCMQISNSHRTNYQLSLINYSFNRRLKQPHMCPFWWLSPACQARGSTLPR